MIKTNNPMNVLISAGIVTGAILGGALGLVANFSPVWGLLIGGVVGGLFGQYSGQPKPVLDDERTVGSTPSATLKLCEEQLDIIKKQVPAGKVNLRTEVVTEEKTIVIPVTHEVLIIEKTVLDSDTPTRTEPVTEIIRIPIREEQFEVIKHSVELEDVNVYQRQFQTTETVTETVKKEKLHVETSGEAGIISGETEAQGPNE